MVTVLGSLSGFGTPDGGKRLLKKHKNLTRRELFDI